MVNSRRKGNAAEREILKLLREAWGGKWERRSMGVPGPDLVAPDDFPYAVEVKHCKAVKAKHLLVPNSVVEGFWYQCNKQANNVGLLPLLTMKIEGSWYACVPYPKLEALKHRVQIRYHDRCIVPLNTFLEIELKKWKRSDAPVVTGSLKSQSSGKKTKAMSKSINTG